MNPGLLRLIAVGIAIAALIDPGFTRNRSSRPIVAIVTAGSTDRETANDVRRELRSDFTVVDGALPDAAATVVVGDGLPAALHDLSRPVFAVTTDSASSAVTITGIASPARAPLNSRVQIAVETRVRGSRNDSLILTLRSAGATNSR
jgi:hypothetical protein